MVKLAGKMGPAEAMKQRMLQGGLVICSIWSLLRVKIQNSFIVISCLEKCKKSLKECEVMACFHQMIAGLGKHCLRGLLSLR